MGKIKTNYRGFEIYFNAGSCKEEEKWKSELGEKWEEKNSYHDIEKKIDAFIKKESEYTNLKVYLNIWSGIKEAVITSEDRNNKDVWIRVAGEGRERRGKKGIYKLNTHNANIIKEMESVESKIKALKEDNKKWFKQMERVFE